MVAPRDAGEWSDVTAAPLDWPTATAATRPWTRWWWPGNAVDDANLERELSRLDEVGVGGVEVTPIYGVDGERHAALDFLSPGWIDSFEHAVSEATRRGMGVDGVPGTGWHFGGPSVEFEDSAMKFDAETARVGDDDRFEAEYDPERLQTVVAYADDGRTVELTGDVGDDGRLAWRPDRGSWSVVSIVGRTGRDVKRAAPDREGPMVSPFSPGAMRRYLSRFDREFADYDGPPLRATFHDSFEFDAHWSPHLLDAFEERCGYRLQEHLPALLGDADGDRVGRVTADYRRVLSALYAETVTEWTRWNHESGRQARFQAHCAPGNILDLYALADVPETELIGDRRCLLGAKFAASAGHVSGSRRVSAETATWLDEHFTVSLAALKGAVDELFLVGVNHVVFHGTAYSPDDAPWPGWLFYASTQLNSRNPIWRDLPALTDYVTRCQSVLQSGRPDADLLLYWPVEDVWHAEEGFAERIPILDTPWMESYPFGRVAGWLRERGYSFDYVSDRQLRDADVVDGRLAVAGGDYEGVVVPRTDHAPVETVAALRDAAAAGGTVVFEERLPGDVPGLGSLDERRDRLASLCDDLGAMAGRDDAAPAGDGRVLIGDVAEALSRTGVRREPLVDEGLQFVRRTFDGGTHYFLVNTAETAHDGWVRLSVDAADVATLDPMTGDGGVAATRNSGDGTAVYCQLDPGESVVLRAFADGALDAAPAEYWTDGDAVAVEGPWTVEFIRGGPERPPGAELDELVSWTELGDLHRRFAGTARYAATFDRPADGEEWWLDLGDVADSATVWLDGTEIGTVVDAPYRLPVEGLDPTGNELAVEVTSRAANRIRDLDRRDVDWKRFGDINFVDVDYEPFDAADWDLRPAGLLGPVELVPRRALDP